jgi:hypothetical protein
MNTDGQSVEAEIEREDRLDIARTLYQSCPSSEILRQETA